VRLWKAKLHSGSSGFSYPRLLSTDVIRMMDDGPVKSISSTVIQPHSTSGESNTKECFRTQTKTTRSE
jgi:hypothetical protein